ncbi:MAG: hypothetical protein CM15mV12_2910 [uncultured marine virus]|nr:MAG: hypothetical protein CM15mV12_2910 [uncultured marine virus]
MQLVTYEAIKNNYASVEIRKDGKISEHVKKIFKDKKYLNTKKKLNIDDTANNLNIVLQRTNHSMLLIEYQKMLFLKVLIQMVDLYLGRVPDFFFMKHTKDFISKVLIVCLHKNQRKNYFQ